jgi:hypothetical protein
MAAEETSVVTVTASDGEPKAVEGSYADPRTPLAGFSMIEANGVDEVVQLRRRNSVCPRQRSHRDPTDSLHQRWQVHPR